MFKQGSSFTVQAYGYGSFFLRVSFSGPGNHKIKDKIRFGGFSNLRHPLPKSPPPRPKAPIRSFGLRLKATPKGIQMGQWTECMSPVSGFPISSLGWFNRHLAGIQLKVSLHLRLPPGENKEIYVRER